MDTPPGLLTALKRKLGILPPVDPRPDARGRAAAQHRLLRPRRFHRRLPGPWPFATPRRCPRRVLQSRPCRPRRPRRRLLPRPSLRQPRSPRMRLRRQKPGKKPDRSGNRPPHAAISCRWAPFPRAPMPSAPPRKWGPCRASRQGLPRSGGPLGSRRMPRGAGEGEAGGLCRCRMQRAP
jgi:rare lipoprotein A